VKVGKVLIDCFANDVKCFFLGDVGAVPAGEKRHFIKAVYYPDEVYSETFFGGKLDVAVDGWRVRLLLCLLEQFNLFVYDAAKVLRILLFV
jgi:hypothetical protein